MTKSPKITSIKDAFFTYYRRPDLGILLFWSSDWYSRHPWSYEGVNTSYIDRKVYNREMGYMTSYVVGPLCVVIYRKYK